MSKKKIESLTKNIPSSSVAAATIPEVVSTEIPEMKETNPVKSPPQRAHEKSVFLDIGGCSHIDVAYNYKWPEANDDFPGEPFLRTVDYCFKNSSRVDGKMLLVDQPQDIEHESVKRKAEKLLGHGYCYVIIKLGASFEEAIEEIEKVKHDMDNKSHGTQAAAE